MKASSVVLIDNLPSGVPGPEHFRIDSSDVSDSVGDNGAPPQVHHKFAF